MGVRLIKPHTRELVVDIIDIGNVQRLRQS
jgi:hypothetical protein